MTEYQGDTDDYKSLSEFFIRSLDPAKRTLKKDETAIVSPADGVLTEVETIYQDQAFQVKGKSYSVSQFINEELDFSQGWHVAVIYLSPSNYHRYHYPISGKITRYMHTGGRLFPVNQMGLNCINRLFVKNERIVTEFETNGNRLYAVPVGATFVGSIKMEFIEGKSKSKHKWTAVDRDVTQLDEMGRFEMGSTIILVLPKKMAHPIDAVKGKPVRAGEPIFPPEA